MADNLAIEDAGLLQHSPNRFCKQILSLPPASTLSFPRIITFYWMCRAKRLERQRGRGVVMAAGGPIPLANAYVALHMLRNVHNCSLPVELFFNGTQELDWPTRIFFTVRTSNPLLPPPPHPHPPFPYPMGDFTVSVWRLRGVGDPDACLAAEGKWASRSPLPFGTKRW